MTPDTFLARTYTDLQGLNAVRALAHTDSPQAVHAVAREFEAMFIQMMLKGMREAALADNPFDSSQMRVYQDLFDKQVAMDLSRRGELKVGELITRQLQGNKRGANQVLPEESLAVRRAYGNSFITREPASIHGGGASLGFKKTPVGPIRSAQEYIAVMRPHAEAAARELGVIPEVLLAQSALESGWGKHVMRRPDGSSSHNLFGIKASSAWSGDRVSVGSLEYENGVARKRISAFRAYDSYAESFMDYVRFLRSNPRYAKALGRAHDPEAFVESLQAAGYATDPHYARKILAILRREFSNGTTMASAEELNGRG